MAEIDNNDGGSIASRAGDVNGDKIDDIIIAGPDVSYVVFGSKEEWSPSVGLGALDGTNGFIIKGNSYSVNAADDVNGDGIGDFLISDIKANNYTGKTSVVFGSKEQWPAILNLNNDYLDGKRGFVVNGINNNDKSGYAISGAGDMNRDGIKDIIIGAPGANNQIGQSYVLFGNNQSWPAVINLSELDGTNGVIINGIDNRLDGSGASVSWAGDVNADGFADVVIGTASMDYTSGDSYVVFGNKTLPATINLADLDGTNGFVIKGIGHRLGLSGSAVSGAGDVNGDNIADLLIGAWGVNNTAGQSYVVFGNNQAWPPTFDLANINGRNGFTINGINIDDYSFSSVDGPGDVDGDHLADILISAYAANNYAGQTFVVFGSNERWPAAINLTDLDGTVGFTINSDRLYGISSNGAGDFNGNGIQDIVIGTLNSFNNVEKSYVVFGCCEETPASDPSLLLQGLALGGASAAIIALGVGGYKCYQGWHQPGYDTIPDDIQHADWQQS